MRRLFVWYGTALASVVLVAMLVPLGLLASSLAHDRAVEQARQEAQGLGVIAGTGSRGQLRDSVEAVNTGARRTTVFLPGGDVVGDAAARSASVRLAARGHAFTANTTGGVEVLVPVAGATGVTVIRTFVPDSLLNQGVHSAWFTLGSVGVVLLTAAVVAGAVIARRLSRSVTELAHVADRVGAGDLSATIAPSGPAEVASVGRVLNGLGSRITSMLAHERELAADLSHRLRTPVTALRLDVEGLADPAERERMSGHIDALVEAVDAAVLAARSPLREDAEVRCDATAVVSDRARFWAVLADETARSLDVDVPDRSVEVPVRAADLGAALDALIDNVFGHTPDGTAFTVAVRPQPDGTVQVVVEDEGAGLVEPSLAERGRSGAGSTGIGLDVARRTARGGGGDVAVEARPGRAGTRVVMTFGAVQAPPTASNRTSDTRETRGLGRSGETLAES